MQTIRIKFIDFWPGFKADDNYFYHLLSTRYNIVLSDDPEFAICSVFGKEFHNYGCTRILYSGENTRPNFQDYDYNFSFDHLEDPRHYRFPLYGFNLGMNPEKLLKHSVDVELILQNKTKFCNFIYSNPKANKRIEFFHKLSKYKQIDSGGRVLNNIGRFVDDKLAFISSYKFTIAFENASYPGYTTEKIQEPMLADSLPIYWGNPLVHLDFNPGSFINCHDFPDDEAVIEHVIRLDQDDELYRQYLNEPCYHQNQVNGYIKPENVLQQFERIFEAPPPSALTRWHRTAKRFLRW